MKKHIKSIKAVSETLWDAHNEGKLMKSDMLAFHNEYDGDFWLSGMENNNAK